MIAPFPALFMNNQKAALEGGFCCLFFTNVLLEQGCGSHQANIVPQSRRNDLVGS